MQYDQESRVRFRKDKQNWTWVEWKTREKTQSEKCKKKKEKYNNWNRNTKVIRDPYEQLYTNKSENPEEMKNSWTHTTLLKVNEKETENLNIAIRSKMIILVIKRFPWNKSLEPGNFNAEVNQTFE